tara:strand:- start:611 stop:787 length:177 start_codon:yes stop_codon:yes gene_type:complete
MLKELYPLGVPSCSNQTGELGLVVTALIKLLIFISTLERASSFELDVLKGERLEQVHF